MSTVIWCEIEGEDESPRDLGAIYRFLETLDQICESGGIAALSTLVDNSDLQYNLSGDDELDEAWLQANANWHKPSNLEEPLRRIQRDLSTIGPVLGLRTSDISEIADDIGYALERCAFAERVGSRVRLLAVM